MASFVFNVALGKVKYYAELPASTDSIVVIPIEESGVESDATVRDYDTVAAILAAANNEQMTMGRKTAAGVTAAVDDSGNVATVVTDDVTWSAATGNAISDLLWAYKPDSSAVDSALIPLLWTDFAITPDGSDVVADVSTLWQSASAT